MFLFHAGGYEANISHCRTATGYLLAFQTDLRICDFVKNAVWKWGWVVILKQVYFPREQLCVLQIVSLTDKSPQSIRGYETHLCVQITSFQMSHWCVWSLSLCVWSHEVKFVPPMSPVQPYRDPV